MLSFFTKNKRPKEVFIANLDYDKLADALVKAQRDLDKRQENDGDSPTFKQTVKAIGNILKGKRSKDGRYLSAPFSIIVSLLYRTITIAGFLALVLFMVAIITILKATVWQGWAIAKNAFLIIFSILIVVTVALYLLLLWGAANDMEYEQDKNYVVAVFSGMVSAAALVVAIIAIFRT